MSQKIAALIDAIADAAKVAVAEKTLDQHRCNSLATLANVASLLANAEAVDCHNSTPV
jgi:hypothetical protein